MKYLLILPLLLLTACTGTNSWHGDGFRVVTLTDTGIIDPTTQYNVLQRCLNEECTRRALIRTDFVSESGIVKVVGGSALIGAGIAAGGKFLGDGIADADLNVDTNINANINVPVKRH